MTFDKTRQKVEDQGRPPESFLIELIEWAKSAPGDIFKPMPDPLPPEQDIYARVRPLLGPWESALHRKAAMLEVMRVHAGFESSWDWNEGVDTTNQTSMHNIIGQETGLFQVSFNSTALDHGAMRSFAEQRGIGTPTKFIPAMKEDHRLALEYYARLIRHSIRWAGPILRHEIDEYLKRDSVGEFMSLLA